MRALRLRAGRVGVVAALACVAANVAIAADDAPEVDYPRLPVQVADLDELAPPMWTVESRDDGDLNADGRVDALLVLKLADPRNLLESEVRGAPRFDSNPRMLVVALAAADGGWRMVAQDHALIPRPSSPYQDDYLDGADAVAITPRGTFTVKLHLWSSAGSWTSGSNTFTFRVEGDCVRLIGYDAFSFHRASGDENTLSVNYLTGRAQTLVTRVEEPQTQESWERFAMRRICLEEVGDGIEFVPMPAPAASAPGS